MSVEDDYNVVRRRTRGLQAAVAGAVLVGAVAVGAFALLDPVVAWSRAAGLWRVVQGLIALLVLGPAAGVALAYARQRAGRPAAAASDVPHAGAAGAGSGEGSPSAGEAGAGAGDDPAPGVDPQPDAATLLAAVEDIVTVHDPDGRFVYVSPAMARRTGHEPEALLGRSAYDLMHPDDRERVREESHEPLLRGGPTYIRWRLRRRDGSYIWVESNNHLVTDAHGRPQRIITTTRDISARQAAEDAMREHQRVLGAMFDASHDALFLVDARTHRVVDVNQQAVCMFEAGDKGELIGLEGSELHRERLSEAEVNAAFEAAARGETWRRDAACVTRRGRTFWGDVAVVRLPLGDRELNLVRIADVTQRKAMEAEVQRGRAQLEAMIHSAHNVAIQTFDRKGRVRIWNNAAVRLFGWRREEAVGRTLGELMLEPDQAAAFGELLERIERTGEPAGPMEWRFRTREGHRGVVASSVFRLGDAESDDRFVCMDVDITDFKESEENLRRALAHLDSLVRNTPLACVQMDREGRITHWSDRAEQIFGWSADEAIGQRYLQLGVVHPEDQAHVEREMHHLTEGRQDRMVLLSKNRRKDGRTLHCEWFNSTLHDEAGRATTVLSLAQDVTSRESALSALRASDERFRQMAEQIRDVFWLKSADGRTIYVSPAYESIWARPQAELNRQHDAWLRAVHRDDREHVARAFQAVLKGEVYEAEYRVVRPDESVRWVHDRGYPVYDEHGRPYRIAGLARDITERKQFEERQRLMVRELDHRVKNTLASVLSIAKQTLSQSASPEEFAPAFHGRIETMARTHEALAAGRWQGLDLEHGVRETVGAFVGPRGSHGLIHGPRVTLAADVAMPVCLALHELATNAAKYGSLSVPGGSLTIEWDVADGVVELDWIERDGPPVHPPASEGLGTTLVRGLIGYELRGRVNFEYRPEGFRCHLAFPLEPGDDRDAAA